MPTLPNARWRAWWQHWDPAPDGEGAAWDAVRTERGLAGMQASLSRPEAGRGHGPSVSALAGLPGAGCWSVAPTWRSSV